MQSMRDTMRDNAVSPQKLVSVLPVCRASADLHPASMQLCVCADEKEVCDWIQHRAILAGCEQSNGALGDEIHTQWNKGDGL
jgi:hypothetical protein